MAKKNKKKIDWNNPLLESLLNQIKDGFFKCEKRFMSALEDSEKKRMVLHFDATLDRSGAADVVDVKLSFKDKCKEGGLDVMKTFSCGSSAELDDPKQPRLIPDV